MPRLELACLAFLAITAASPLAAMLWLVDGRPPSASPQAPSPIGGMLGTFTLGQFSLAFACMLIAWRAPAATSRRALTWLLATGVVARLILLPVYPYTSNDFERYLWDGRVALEGLDPYRMSPDAPALASLRETWATPPEHAHLPTLYPPAALALFALSATLGPETAWLGWKALMGAASLAILFLGRRLLQRLDREQHFALLALSPLLVFELGVGAHVDGASTLAITGALWALTRDRPLETGLWIGVGALCKILPLLLVAPLVWHFRRERDRALRLVAATAATISIGYAAAFSIGWIPAGSMATFFEQWRFGSPLFLALDAVLGGPMLLAALVFAALLVVLFGLRWTRGDPARWMQVALALPLLLGPVVFPWYLSALVPVVALLPSSALLAWMGAMPLTYEVLDGFLGHGEWRPALWPLVTIAGSILIGLVCDHRATPPAPTFAPRSRVRS